MSCNFNCDSTAYLSEGKASLSITILWKPREGEELCRFEDLEKIMQEQGDEVALLMIGTTNYYTGQSFPIKKITQLGHQYNCKVGFDLAHGAGNIQPQLLFYIFL